MASIDRQSSSTFAAPSAFIKRRSHNHGLYGTAAKANINHKATVNQFNQFRTHNNSSSINSSSNPRASGTNGHPHNKNDNISRNENNSHNNPKGDNEPKMRKDHGKDPGTGEDSYSAYRRLCEVRMRRLERYKKARSFCSLHDESSAGNAGSNAAEILGESKGNLFELSQSRYRRAYDADALNDNTKAASTSCSHLLTPLNHNDSNNNSNHNSYMHENNNNGFSADKTSIRHSKNSKSHDEGFPAVASSRLVGMGREPFGSTPPDKALRQQTADTNSICVDSEEPNGHFSPIRTPVNHETPSPEENFAEKSFNLDKNNNYWGNNDENEIPTQAIAAGNKASPLNLQFEILREKMIAIMENDVQLLKKLLTLGETIQEIRGVRSGPTAEKNNNNSQNYNNTQYEDGTDDSDEIADEWRPLKEVGASAAVTRLYVGGESARDDGDEPAAADDDDTDDVQPNVQYFSRKNSVLRIPIPPRSSNRRLGKHAALKPSDLLRSSISRSSTTTAVAAAAPVGGKTRLAQHSEDSGHSSASNSPPGQCSPSGAAAGGLRASLDASAPTEMAIFALRSELKASLINGGAKTGPAAGPAASAADSGRSTLIQCSSSCASSECGTAGGSSRFSTFSAESFCMAAAAAAEGDGASKPQTILVGGDEKCGAPLCGGALAPLEFARPVS